MNEIHSMFYQSIFPSNFFSQYFTTSNVAIDITTDLNFESCEPCRNIFFTFFTYVVIGVSNPTFS